MKMTNKEIWKYTGIGIAVIVIAFVLYSYFSPSAKFNDDQLPGTEGNTSPGTEGNTSPGTVDEATDEATEREEDKPRRPVWKPSIAPEMDELYELIISEMAALLVPGDKVLGPHGYTWELTEKPVSMAYEHYVTHPGGPRRREFHGNFGLLWDRDYYLLFEERNKVYKYNKGTTDWVETEEVPLNVMYALKDLRTKREMGRPKYMTGPQQFTPEYNEKL